MAGPQYQAMVDRGAAAVDAVHGENVRIVPQTSNQHAGTSADVTRAVIELVAVLRTAAGQSAGLGMHNVRENTEMGTGGSMLHISRAILPLDADIRKGDEVIALDRPGAPRFVVARPDNRGLSRMQLQLTALRATNA